MGTKIQANAFLREFHPVIDLEASSSNGISSLYCENQTAKDGQNPHSFVPPKSESGYLGYDREKVRQTILEHESIFRDQLQELHRLYGRQKELMNEIRRREIKKAVAKEEKSQSSLLFPPILPEDAKRTRNAPHSSSLHSMASCVSASGTGSKQFPTFLDGKVVPDFPPTQDTRILSSCEPWLYRSSIFPKGTCDLRVHADVYSDNMEKQVQERFSKLPGVENTSGSRNHQALYDDTKLSLSAVQTSQCNADALTFDLCANRTNHGGDICINKPIDGIPDGLSLSKVVSANSSSPCNLVTKDFFQISRDGINGRSSQSVPGSRDEKSRKEHLSDDYAEKMRFDKHSSVGDFCSGKSLAFSQPFSQTQLVEQRKEFSNSVSRRARKLFGVEIDNNPSDAASTVETKIGHHQENHCVVSSRSSLWITKPFVENLELGGTNANGGKNGTLVETSNQRKFSCHSDLIGNWLRGSSAIGLNLDKVPNKVAESDPVKCFTDSKHAEVLKKDSEHSQNFQHLVHQHQTVLAHGQNNHENPKGGLPWFLRNSQDNGDLSKGMKSPYFMNLDSLQNCSQNFFRKTELADGTFQALKQKKDISAPIAEDGINELNETSTGTKKILGIPISDMLQSFEDLNSGDNPSKFNSYYADGDSTRKVEVDKDIPRNQLENKDLGLQKGLNDCISDLSHHIDLNLSVDEEVPSSAPSLPTTIVKIATTEIDLEASAVIDSEMDAPPKKDNSMKTNLLSRKSESTYEECDKVAAEAILAISSYEKETLVDSGAREPPAAADSSCLNWFAEIISSQCDNIASIHVEASLDPTGAHDEEESVPDGMDYFEYLTLKIEETKAEHYQYEPLVPNNPTDDETGNATLPKRSRRGQSRRGRLWKDFQRDILPGLVTLSRLEVTEDFQAFEELMKAEGSSGHLGSAQRSSTRNGRGRKRSGGPTTTQKPVFTLEDRSLTGWGKRTRRLPRQRCPSAFISFPVKC